MFFAPSAKELHLQVINVFFCIFYSQIFDAGLRIGYGAFPLGMIEYMWRIKQPYNVSVAAENAAIAALRDAEYYEVRKKKNNLFYIYLIPFTQECQRFINFGKGTSFRDVERIRIFRTISFRVEFHLVSVRITLIGS